MTKRALITGITGQDGAYLAEFLLKRGYQVHGMVRRSSSENFERIGHLRDTIQLHQADLLDQFSIVRLVDEVQPHHLYNLAAQSFVPTSFEQPLLTGEFTALGSHARAGGRADGRSLDPCLPGQQQRDVRIVSARSRRRETTPFWPRSPYGVAKVYGHWITVNYRESYDLFACSGILFNHESPLARQGIRDAQDHRCRGPHQARLAEETQARQSRRACATGDSPGTTCGPCG